MKNIRTAYLVGNMEHRTYQELFYEHFYIRSRLAALGLKVIDPLLKERHSPNKQVTLTKCGIKPKTVYELDMKAVEVSEILFWITGDIVSEGSITEIATGGAWNRWGKKPVKTIVIISPKRAKKEKVHFSNFHKGVKIFEKVDDGIEFIRKRFKL